MGAYGGGEMGGAIFDPQTTAESIQGLRGAASQVTDVGTRLYMQERGIAAQQQAATQHQDALYSRMHLRDFGMTEAEMAGEKAREIQAGSIPADTTDAGYRQVLAKRRLQMTGDEYIRRDRERYFFGRTGGRMGYAQALEQNPDDPMAVLAPAIMEYQEQQQAERQQQAQAVQYAQQVQQASDSLPQNSDVNRELSRARYALVGANAGFYPGNPPEQAKQGLRRQMMQDLRTAERKVIEEAEASKMTPERRQQQVDNSVGYVRHPDTNEIIITEVFDEQGNLKYAIPYRPPTVKEPPIRTPDDVLRLPLDDSFRSKVIGEARRLAREEIGEPLEGPPGPVSESHLRRKMWQVLDELTMVDQVGRDVGDYKREMMREADGQPAPPTAPSPPAADPQAAQQLQEAAQQLQDTNMKIREIMAEIKSKGAELSPDAKRALIQEYIQLAQTKTQLEQASGAAAP